MMTSLDAIILGLIQGLTEFLPVSSSGHLHLFEHFLGLKELDKYIIFDLTCHLGTLLAICIFFKTSIKELFQQNRARLYQIVIATLPLFPLVALMKPIKAVYADPSYLGFFFLFTAFILFLGVYFGKTKIISKSKHTWRDALKVGLWQALAIFPGVSRSGSTITGGRLLGWSIEEAMTFSFLLAIPTILGATTLELFNWVRHPESVVSLPFEHYIIGFIVSLIVGLFSLKLLTFIVMHHRFYYFAWYCLFLGIATTCYFQL